jgi:hypothetical protein
MKIYKIQLIVGNSWYFVVGDVQLEEKLVEWAVGDVLECLIGWLRMN